LVLLVRTSLAAWLSRVGSMRRGLLDGVEGSF
jgi:hypothetical protein